MKRSLYLVLFFALFFQYTLCAQSDHMFRARKNITIIEPPYSKSDIEAEIVFGRELASKVSAKYGLYENVNLNKYITKVGKNLARFSTRPELDFKFAVLDTDEINAYACPGGYIFVTKGALKNMRNESELAGVLGHEISHITQRHIVKELDIRGKNESDSFTAILSARGANAARVMSKMLDTAYESLMSVGFKDHAYEFEADEMGTYLMYNTGYDTTSLYIYLNRISKKDMRDIKIIYDTHPSFYERIEKLKLVNTVNRLTEEQLKQLQERFESNVKI